MGKFKELLPVLSSRHLSQWMGGRVYGTCVRSVINHASDIWPMTRPSLQRLLRNYRSMTRWICNIKPQDVATVRPSELLARLGLRERKFRWSGHVERSSGAIKCAHDFQEGKCAWESKDVKKGPDWTCSQRVEALDTRPSWQMHLESWSENCHYCS